MTLRGVAPPSRTPGPGRRKATDRADVGRRIRALRMQRRLTLNDVAAKSGITQSALSQIEREQASPTVGTLKAIASALSVTIGDLFPASRSPGRAVVHPAERK